jgi:hypothetical protein
MLEDTNKDSGAPAGRFFRIPPVNNYLAHIECGYDNWYDFNRQAWGTKWNAGDTSVSAKTDTSVDFTFQTAWSPPVPIIEKLCELFPDIEMEWLFFDEGWGFAGSYTYSPEEGVALYDIDINNEEAMRAHYERVYGEEPEIYDEDEE